MRAAILLLALSSCATIQKAQPYLQPCEDSFIAGTAQALAPNVVTCLASADYGPCLDALVPVAGNAVWCSVKAVLKAYTAGAASFESAPVNLAVNVHGSAWLKLHSLQLATPP